MSKPCIAFCFLIYEKINLEEIWVRFFEQVDPALYRIYIHYKVNKPLKYPLFERRKLPAKQCVPTKYADVSLIHAHNVMFKQAYNDGCSKMINLSQACIPFKSFSYIYHFLTQDDYGHFNVAPVKNGYKSYEWFILNRTLCQELANNADVTKINATYQSIYAPEERYYITAIHEKKLLQQIRSTSNLALGATTFTNWLPRGLKTYNFITPKEMDALVASNSLFGRKFTAECFVALKKHQPYWNTIVNTLKNN